MTIKASTGLRNLILGAESLSSALDLGYIHMYAGPVPESADAALGAGTVLLVTISEAGSENGLTFDTAAVDGVILKNPAEAWRGVNIATGTATFYRHVGAGDTGGLSTTQPRLQGAIGLAGSDMNLTGTALNTGATQTLDFYAVALPTL